MRSNKLSYLNVRSDRIVIHKISDNNFTAMLCQSCLALGLYVVSRAMRSGKICHLRSVTIYEI